MSNGDEVWRPLNVRRGLRDDHVLAEGVPAHLAGPLERWLSSGLTDKIADLIGLRRSVVVDHVYETPVNALLTRCRSDEDLFLDVIDFRLRVRSRLSGADVEHLRRILELSGSAWTVRSDGQGLERRVDPTCAAAAEKAIQDGATLGNSAGDQLATAWRAAYGRQPDPSRALSQAIKAVESAAAPVLAPNDRKATLGRLIGVLDGDAARWRLPLATNDKNGPIATVVGMMQSLWHAQSDRHGGIDATRPVSQAQAEAALPLAVALVQLFAAGAVGRSV